MAKENYIKFRCSDEFKVLVEQKAKEHGRSVSSYIEYLIRKDTDTMRVIYDYCVTDEMTKAFEAEETIYKSTNGENWLFTDMEVFNEMDKRFKFDVDTDKDEHIDVVNMERYLFNRYESEYVEYFGLHFDMVDYAEGILDVIEDCSDDLCCSEWEEVIDAWVKEGILLAIESGVEEIFAKMVDDGWDISRMKNVVTNALKNREE